MKESSANRDSFGALVKSWLILNVLLLSVVAAISMTYPVEELNRRLSDIYFRLRRPLPTSRLVALVLIDDTSLNRYGRWPWPRSVLARLVRATAAHQPSAIGLDILLSEAENARSDSDLAKTLADAGNVLLATKLAAAQQGKWTDPLPLFRASSAGLGHVQAVEDSDGICRSVPLRELSVEGPRWAFALEVARVARRAALEERPDGLWLGENHVFLDSAIQRAGPHEWQSFSPNFLTVNFRDICDTSPSQHKSCLSCSSPCLPHGWCCAGRAGMAPFLKWPCS